MPRKLHVVRLSADQRETLRALVRTGTHPARTIQRARIVLLAEVVPERRARTDAEIADAVGVHPATVKRTRAAWGDRGLACVDRKVRLTPPVPPKLSAAQEVQIAAVACTEPPAGYARWSVRLLARRVVELDIVESISHETIRRTLKKTTSRPGPLSAS
jgi:transposase